MGSIEKYRTLAQRVGLFRGVSPEDVAKIVAKGTTMRVPKDEVIFHQQTTGNIILLTTSGEGDWLPDKEGYEFDAMSGASVKSNINDVAQDLMIKIRSRVRSEDVPPTAGN